MKTFREYVRMREELWLTTGPQDNPSNPGIRRKDAKDLYNHRYGGGPAPVSLPVKKMKRA